jgi:molecular chaperone DnaJ
MSQVPDYYAVLGVSRDATLEEIRRAYRREARRCHPDVARDDPQAEERFKQLTEAYRVLSDPELRARYDHFGQIDGPIPYSSPEDFLFEDLFDLVDSLFGVNTGRRPRSRGATKGSDLSVDVTIALEEAFTGTTREIIYKRKIRCSACNGTGCASGSEPEVCRRCGGTGQVHYVRQAFFAQLTSTGPCRECGGRGRVIRHPCGRCKGEGLVSEQETVRIDIPAGVQDGEGMVLEGYGNFPAHAQGRAGDLYVQVRVAPHPRFQRRGQNLYAVLPVNPAQAALGAIISVDGIDGPIQVALPAGVQHGTEIRIPHRGLPTPGGRRGDVSFIVNIVIPQPETRHERNLLEELAKIWSKRSN